MIISNHRLDSESAEFISCDKTSGKFAEGLPDTVIIHYTAGPTAESAIRTFTESDAEASAHLVVDRDGSVTQLMPFDTIGWHVGKSALGDRTGFNKYSIGIEIVNAGRLEQSGDQFVAWFGRKYGRDDVKQAVHRNEEKPSWWHLYTEEQISKVEELCELLIGTYDIKEILGHEEISPSRKEDPGPAFPLDKMREKLLRGDRREGAEEPKQNEVPLAQGVVTASKLNFRSGPSASNPTIANPLSRDTNVTILDEADGWYQVEVKMRGWVSKKFVRER